VSRRRILRWSLLAMVAALLTRPSRAAETSTTTPD